MKFGSLFTGVGGFDLGLERAGFECAWQVERDQHCLEVLSEHYPSVERYTDVRTVGKHNLEPVELICGGFPCQDLSVAGKRAGFAGERSSLWFEFERIIDELRPQWVIVENVPGLLSSRNGADFALILKALDDRGYGVAWRVLDSQNFRVAQRRRRVFIVASLGNTSCAEVLFESESVSGNIAKGGKAGEDVAYSLRANPSHSGDKGDGGINTTLVTATLRGFGHGWQGQHNDTNAVLTYAIHQNDDHRKDRPNGGFYVNQTDKSLTLQTGQAKGQTVVMSSGYRMTAFGEYADDNLASTLKQRDWKDATDLIVLNDQGGSQMSVTENVSATLRSQEHGHQPIVFNAGDRRQGVDSVSNTTSPCIQAKSGTGGNNVPLVGVRRLTPTECERLQGFPDGWTASQSDTQRYKQMGNAVTVNVIEWIGNRISNKETKWHFIQLL